MIRPLMRLMRGKRVSMTTEKQHRLAQWTAKTVLLYDYAKYKELTSVKCAASPYSAGASRDVPAAVPI